MSALLWTQQMQKWITCSLFPCTKMLLLASAAQSLSQIKPAMQRSAETCTKVRLQGRCLAPVRVHLLTGLASPEVQTWGHHTAQKPRTHRAWIASLEPPLVLAHGVFPAAHAVAPLRLPEDPGSHRRCRCRYRCHCHCHFPDSRIPLGARGERYSTLQHIQRRAQW